MQLLIKISILRLKLTTTVINQNITNAINENNTTIINKVDKSVDVKIAENNKAINNTTTR